MKLWQRIFIVGLVLCLAIRLVLAWQPVQELSWRVNADDAYYYFKLAQNIGAGLGATFDGINPTNGFHPLYALLLVPLFKLAGSNVELGVHLALTLVALFNVATAWPIYLIGLQIHSRRVGMIAALLYVANPWAIVLTMTGVESAVYVFFFAWAVVAYLHWRRHPHIRTALLTGVLVGLTIMARSEGGLLLAGITVDVLLRGRTSVKQALVALLQIGFAATLVCLPWAIWSTMHFGTPLQVSGSAIMLHSHAEAPATLGSQVAWYLKRTSWFVPRFVVKVVLYSFPVVLLAVALGTWVFVCCRKHFWKGIQATAPLSFLWLPYALIAIYYNLVLWHQQHWYFNALVLIVTLCIVPSIDVWLAAMCSTTTDAEQPRGMQPFQSFVKVMSKQWTIVGAHVLLIVLCIGIVSAMWVRGVYPAQKPHYASGRWIATSDVQSGVFGYTDSGILGYACACTMVNLDGVMNNAAYRHYTHHGYSPATIGAYMADSGVEYMILAATAGEGYYGPAVRLEQVQQIGAFNRALYRVVPAQLEE